MDTYDLEAPWITIVGAGTLDRDFPAFVSLGDGKNLFSVSLYGGTPLPEKSIPLVYNVRSTSGADMCMSGSRVPKEVAGKIVLCNRGGSGRPGKGLVVKQAGGLGMIIANTKTFGEALIADAHLLPAANVGEKVGDAIKKYISSNSDTTAQITFGGTQLGVQPSPVVAAFSSRSPNTVTPEILRPDLIAPGVNLLAGWTGKVGPTGLTEDNRRVSFNIRSGTSVSCPHISGLATLVKAAHPDWSPAAIKSAFMTTAYATYKNGKTILDVATGVSSTPFDHGAGHVDPMKSLDPGFVYDATVEDYLEFLCALNYSSSRIKSVCGGNFSCSSSKKRHTLQDFNCPSFAVPLPTASGKGGGRRHLFTLLETWADLPLLTLQRVQRLNQYRFPRS